jgi:hypothetical protein
MTPVTSVSYGTSPSPQSFLAGKLTMFGEDKMTPVYFVSSKGILVHKYPLILRYNDCLVLEIIIQWTGKTILWQREKYVQVYIDNIL